MLGIMLEKQLIQQKTKLYLNLLVKF